MSVSILIGDCRLRMKELPGNSVDSVVCDPPYHLTSIVKRFGAEDSAPCKVGATGAYARASKGFMGQTWDGGDVAFQPETWAEVLRVLKPGGHLVAFAATRGGHRMTCAIEDAGFEIRDCLGWVFASGFPKSLNVSAKLADSLPADVRCACAPGCRQTVPGSQSDCPSGHGFDGEQPRAGSAADQDGVPSLADVQTHNPSRPRADGLAATPSHNHSSSSDRLSSEYSAPAALRQLGECQDADSVLSDTPSNTSNVELMAARKRARGTQDTQHSDGGSVSSSSELPGYDNVNLPRCDDCGKFVIEEGLGTALKPAWEMICLARKPLSEKSIAANVLKWGTGALNIDGCRIGTEGGTTRGEHDSNEGRKHSGDFTRGNFGVEPLNAGRWPANLCHDGSEEVVAGFPAEAGQQAPIRGTEASLPAKGDVVYGYRERVPFEGRNDSGSAARFFYCAKATTEERGDGNNHPTVKPVALMRWLVRLVTPKGGTVLDPFMGSGSTGLAADAEQFNFIGCEMSPEYAAIAERRIRDAAGMFADVKVAA